jgi:hypothetical protein
VLSQVDGVVIDDGNPWWLSPNVWAVQASAPNDPSPGTLAPVAGHSYYLKATVRNTEPYRIENAKVDFFWANPTAGISRSTASQVGTAFASANAGSSVDALCLTPWTPSYINQGHECIVAAVTQPGGVATAALDAPNDVHVAQRNLSVLLVGRSGFSFSFEICNPSSAHRVVDVRVEPGKLKEVGPLVGSGFPALAKARGEVVDRGFVRAPCPDPEDTDNRHALEGLEVAGGTCAGATLVGHLQGTAALLHITQNIGETIVGGLSVLVAREEVMERD